MSKFNKQLHVIAALALLPVAVLAANSNFDDEVNAELDRMYKSSVAQSAPPPVQVNVSQNQGQTQDQGQLQTQKMPVTYVEASPLTESRADKIRKARQDVEIQTEQKIVEKLEMSRIDDERRRAEVLFGDKFNQLSANQTQDTVVVNQQPVANQVVMPAQVQTVAPTPVAVAAPVQEITIPAQHHEAEEKIKNKSYFSANLGVSDYPEAANLRGKYSAGFAFGMLFSGKVAVEGSYSYGSYQVEQVCSPYTGAGCSGGQYGPYSGGMYGSPYSPYGPQTSYGAGNYYPTITQMDQHQAALTAKYLLMHGYTFRPVVGASMAYTYRSFTDTQFSRYNSDATSYALDLGFVTGAELELSQDFAIGLDYKYFMNLTNQTNSNFQKSFVFPTEPHRKPVEAMSYYTLGILGRISF